MNRRDFLQTLGVAVPAAAATSLMARPSAEDAKRESKDVAERILDTRRMNCSYIPYGRTFIKDPNTGAMSGIFHNLTQRLCELVGLEPNWNIETTYATFSEDLTQGKADVLAGGIWSNPTRAKVANFSVPAFYSGLGVYVRAGDHRFDDAVSKINDPKIRLATIDGEMSQIIQQSDYPKASTLSLPNNTDVSMLAEQVASGKADATFLEKPLANLYLQKNPGTLRNLADAKPIRIFENTWAFAYGSERLKNMLDTAVKTMIYSGYVEQVLAQYGEQNGYYAVRAPIQ